MEKQDLRYQQVLIQKKQTLEVPEKQISVLLWTAAGPVQKAVLYCLWSRLRNSINIQKPVCRWLSINKSAKMLQGVLKWIFAAVLRS